MGKGFVCPLWRNGCDSYFLCAGAYFVDVLLLPWQGINKALAPIVWPLTRYTHLELWSCKGHIALDPELF